MKLLSVASLTGSILGLLVSASWVPSAQATYPCPGPGPDEIQVGKTQGGNGLMSVPLCQKKTNGEGSNSGSSAEPSAEPRPDPIRSSMNAIYSITTAMQGNLAERERIMKSPQYQAYMRGGWEFSQDKNDESCSAMFWRKDSIVILSGPSKKYKGAFATFLSKDIPRPASLKTIDVTLIQTNYPPQTTKAFNFTPPNASFGSITLAFPTIEGVLAAMKETIRYELVTDGKSVLNLEWNGGLAARDRLRKCLSARVNK